MEDLRELRDKVLALTNAVESCKAKYRLHEMEARLTELMHGTSESDRSPETRTS